MSSLRNGIKHPQQIESLISENEALKVSLLEANAKIERLTTAMVQTDYECRLRFDHPEPYETLLSQAMKESPAQSLALHDADVIAGYQELLDKRLARQKSPLSTRAIAMGFAKEHIKQLRNSVNKEGE